MNASHTKKTLATLTFLTLTALFLSDPSPLYAEDAVARENHPRFKARFDTNKDGVLSEEEKQAAHDQWKTKHKELRQKADLDGNGKLDPSEKEKFREEFRENKPGARPGKPRRFRRFLGRKD